MYAQAVNKTRNADAPKSIITLCIVLSLSNLWVVAVQGIALVDQGYGPSWKDSKSYGYHQEVTKEARWADAAFEFLQAQNCQLASFINAEDCERIVRLPKESISVHIASTSLYGRYHAILPDERITLGHSHDIVLVLDMFPMVSFGHLVVVFYLDTRLSRASCNHHAGILLDHGECMQLAVRRRCKNLMELRYRKRNFAKRCEINFLPVVHLDTDTNAVKKNQLNCRDDIPGFHACAKLRPYEETSGRACDSTGDHSQACTTTQKTVRTSCKVFEICDQAVIISGGWNRETTGVTYGQNVADMYLLLRRNGFRRKHIKVFYANGVENFEVPGESPVYAHSSSAKMAFRYHLLNMCASPHCVDSLVLYLNSPATHDGTMLLWDANGDGLAEEKEMYTVQEILSDLQDCSARQIQIYVESSYAGELVHAFKQSGRHANVLVMSSGKGYEYSYNHEFTRYWSGLEGTRMCTSDAHSKSQKAIIQSSPMMSNRGVIKKTMSGASCNIRPPYSTRELKRDFFGCQNLPTAVWLKHILQSSEEKRKPFQFT